MWLNRNLTKRQTDVGQLTELLAAFFEVGDDGLETWLKRRFVAKFFGARPHPFIAAMQRPSRATLLGYAIEHRHFLRQWVRSCAQIMANTDRDDVIRYELDNLNTEFGGGRGATSHYELLLRMAESLGVGRERLLAYEPLPDTRDAIAAWQAIATGEHWLEAMAATHGLELVAHPGLRASGACLPYFGPGILASEEYSPETRAFLREGFESDGAHADTGLRLVAGYANELGLVAQVQATFLRSLDSFHRYLSARLARANQIENEL